ncbi:MAG: hypothetical protein AAF934_00455 [Bacteroidota bacterium]
MKTQDDTTREHRSAVAPGVVKEPSTGGKATIVDSRLSTIHQRKLREAMYNSPRVTQLREKQQMMNNSSSVQEHASLRATMNAHAASKALPLQRKTSKGSSRFQQIATAMGEQHGVDTSGLVATHNSSFPAKLNAEATIQGNDIHFAPGRDTDYNIRHEVAHAIDNTLHGTPKGDRVVNGQRIDTTRENIADRMAKAPITQRKSKVAINNGSGSGNEADMMGKQTLYRPQIQEESGSTRIGSSIAGGKTIQRVMNHGQVEDYVDYVNGEIQTKGLDPELLDKFATIQKMLALWEVENPSGYQDYLKAPDINIGEHKGPLHEQVREIIEFFEGLIHDSPPQSTDALLERLRPRLEAMAMRIVPVNALKYYRDKKDEPWLTSDFTYKRRKNRKGQYTTTSAVKIDPDKAHKEIEECGMGACHDYSQAVLKILKGTKTTVRIEGVGSSTGGHNYIIVGRPQGTKIDEPDTWGNNCQVVDLWWGALTWKANEGEHRPDIYYDPQEHIEDRNNHIQLVWYDSSKS